MADAALARTQAITLSIGSVIADRYELRALLGEGGMGAVFRAYDRELDEDVALKVLHSEVAGDVAALTRFRREVKLARRVTHKNVARTFDLGAHDGVRFLTMELILGEALSARARREKIALPEILRVAAEIARGLAEAHVVGVVHRDLKPDNVMLGDDRVVLTDFGIARVADDRGAADMRTGMIVGTPAYMAPEQLENLAVDGRTDVYALGTMLWELLAGRLPFAGESALSIAAQRMTQDAPDVRSACATVPDGVAALVAEMLARRREDRPDAQAVLDRVESLRGNGARARGLVSKLPTLASDTLASLGQPRAVAIDPLESGAETAELARLLTSAVGDALTESRVVHGIVKTSAEADLVVQGTLRASGDRVRARLRVLARKGNVVWAEHVDGSLSDSLAFEDAVVGAVTDAVRARMSNDPGPSDPSLRPAYEEALAEFNGFALPRMRKAIAILEDVEARKPGDPRVRTLLARAMASAWAQLGGRDRAMLARIEELALRALQVDPTIASAHHVIGQIRLNAGELAAAVRATEEALRLDPRDASSHATLGTLLVESLYVNEGRHRLELAARLDPASSQIAFARAFQYALTGDPDKARALHADVVARGGPLAAIVSTMRFAVWFRDKDLALQAAETIEANASGASWDEATLLMRSFIRGEIEPRAAEILAKITGPAVAPRRRALMEEIATEYYAIMGDHERALEHLVALAKLPATNLLWLDACEPIAPLRGDPRFAEARATIAARCAALWGSVGSWPHE
jgi:eukaryotic-like serine/threonine-protein kinase